MKKAQYDHKPLKLEAVGNGSFLYRWAIAEIPATEEKSAMWECYEVLVWNTPNRVSVTAAALTAMWPANDEAKLINDYNAAKENLLDASYIKTYLDFIDARAALKLEIKEFFEKV